MKPLPAHPHLQRDTFTVEVEDVGELQAVTLAMEDNGMMGLDWRLSRVEVMDPRSGTVWTFPYDDWLGPKSDTFVRIRVADSGTGAAHRGVSESGSGTAAVAALGAGAATLGIAAAVVSQAADEPLGHEPSAGSLASNREPAREQSQVAADVDTAEPSAPGPADAEEVDDALPSDDLPDDLPDEALEAEDEPQTAKPLAVNEPAAVPEPDATSTDAPMPVDAPRQAAAADEQDSAQPAVEGDAPEASGEQPEPGLSVDLDDDLHDDLADLGLEPGDIGALETGGWVAYA